MNLPTIGKSVLATELPPIDPFAESPGILVIGGSPQLELAAFLDVLLEAKTPGADTPARDMAYRNVKAWSESQTIARGRELRARGLDQAALFRLLLSGSPPPHHGKFRTPLKSGLSESERRLYAEHKASVKRFLDDADELYRQAGLDRVLSRYEGMVSSTATAFRQGWPTAMTVEELKAAIGVEEQGTLFVVPSLLALEPIRFRFPIGKSKPQARICVLPIGSEGVPEGPDASRIIFEEVASTLLKPLLDRFELELAEVGRGGPPPGSRLVRALYQHVLGQAALGLGGGWSGADSTWAKDKRNEGQTQPGKSLLSAFKHGLESWEARRFRYPTLSSFFPELLERVLSELSGGAEIPRLANPGFERWTGAAPFAWSIEVIEPAVDTPVPSAVTQEKGEKRSSFSLKLSGTRETTEWRGVVSQRLNVLPGDAISLSARMKSKDLSPGGRRVTAAHLEARVFAADGVLIRRVTSTDLQATQDWNTEKIEFTVPAGGAQLQVGCILAMSGELYFSELRLEVDRPDIRRFIRNGGFELEGDSVPSGWEKEIVARTTQPGPAAVSRWELDRERFVGGGHALVLAGDALTSQWLELRSSPVSVTPGQRVAVSAHMASQNVVLAKRQHRHANLTLTFLNARGAEVKTVEGPALEGTHDWTPVAFEAVAPLESTAVRVGCLLTMNGRLWFDDIHLARR